MNSEGVWQYLDNLPEYDPLKLRDIAFELYLSLEEHCGHSKDCATFIAMGGGRP